MIHFCFTHFLFCKWTTYATCWNQMCEQTYWNFVALLVFYHVSVNFYPCWGGSLYKREIRIMWFNDSPKQFNDHVWSGVRVCHISKEPKGLICDDNKDKKLQSDKKLSGIDKQSHRTEHWIWALYDNLHRKYGCSGLSTGYDMVIMVVWTGSGEVTQSCF